MIAPYFSASAASLRQRADIAVHGEDAVGDQQLVAGLVLDFVQQLFGVGGILVAEDLDLGARQAAPSMMLAWFSSSEMMKSSLPRIAETVPALAVKPRLKDHAGFDVLEARDLLLQLHVDLHGAGDGAHRARADAVFLRGFQRGFAQLGMRGQAEVIVGRRG